MLLSIKVGVQLAQKVWHELKANKAHPNGRLLQGLAQHIYEAFVPFEPSFYSSFSERSDVHIFTMLPEI